MSNKITKVAEESPPIGQELLVSLNGVVWDIASNWQYDKTKKRVWICRHTQIEIPQEAHHVWSVLPTVPGAV